MTTDERPERTQDASGHTKRHTHPLISLCAWLFGKEWGLRALEAGYERVMIVLGVVLIVAAALLFWVVWKSMEPSQGDLNFEARGRVNNEMPLPLDRPSISWQDVLNESDIANATPEFKARKYKEAGYYAQMLARDQGRQRETATKVALVPAAAGVMCFVLAFVSFRARLIAAGIVLLGLTAVYATFLVAKKDVVEAEAAMYSVVIAVAGLSGLVCTTLGMVRILATRKGS